MIEYTNLNEIMELYYYQYTLDEMLEMIDNKISYMLEKAQKHAEGSLRTVSYSRAKEKVRSTLLYQTAKKKIYQKEKINIQIMKTRSQLMIRPK